MSTVRVLSVKCADCGNEKRKAFRNPLYPDSPREPLPAVFDAAALREAVSKGVCHRCGSTTILFETEPVEAEKEGLSK